MSADTEEVTPPTDVTLGEEPQSEVQSLITLWSNKSMDPTLPFRRRRPRSAGDMRAVSMMTPPSFKRQPIRWSSSSDIGFRSVESTECYSLSMMRSIRSMEPPTPSRVLQGPDSLDPGPEPVSLPEPGFTADISVKRLPMGYIEPPPSVSGQQNPEEFLIYMAKLIFIM